jgi:hypothetical protein
VGVYWHAGSYVENTKPYIPVVLRIRIRIHRIHVFLGLLDPDPDSLVRGLDPDPDPSIIKQKYSRKTLISTVLCLLFDFLLLKMMYKYLQKVI